MDFSEKLSKQIDIIKSILSDEKLINSKNIESKIYSDQPIIMKASHMAGFMPDEYKKMRAIAKDPQNLGRPDSWIFVEQGRLMADFDDDYVFNRDVARYFPTYQSLNDEELRGYFSWRTKIRLGIYEKAPLTFAYIYLYELLNLIGCNSPDEGFEKMYDFVLKYSETDDGINKYAYTWMFDFTVFHGLDITLLEKICDFSAEKSIEKLLRYQNLNDKELFDSLVLLSSYNLLKSKVYKQYPNELCEIVANVYKAYAVHCDKKCEKSLHIRLFGVLLENTYSMLFNAVFYGRNRHNDGEYVISPIHKYTCKDGLWRCCKYFGVSKNYSNKHIGMILKAADRILREKLGVTPSLAQGKEPKILVAIIEKECDKIIQKQKEAKKRRIDIDVSKLDNIRISSTNIMEKLIVDEEEFFEEQEAEATNVLEVKRTDLPLEDDEIILLCNLLNGKTDVNYDFMLSVAVDSINDKMFDYFGDTIIDFDGDLPYIIEDYSDELKELLKGEEI